MKAVSGFACAELKVNFVEGCAVQRFNGSMFNGLNAFGVSKKAECHAGLVSVSDSAFFVSMADAVYKFWACRLKAFLTFSLSTQGFQWLRRF
ncbi:MAG: hypothetical protein IJK62_03195 [Bacteroidales bacterium]|nr:hypothetical protein [Bacteroidales bacterium]